MKKIIGILSLTILLGSCKQDEAVVVTSDFKVRIENVSTAKDYFISGTTDVIAPGGSYSFTFNAGKGHYLSLVTMFVESNDLFYGFAENGLALYSDAGVPVTGDVTSMLSLYDAGTEVNQEPGTGADQPLRQASANSGTDEGGVVSDIANVNDGFTYPAVSEVLNVVLEHDGGTLFTVTISNISDLNAFQTALAPGVYTINYASQMPVFSVGSASSAGLEALAEDGANTDLASSLSAASGFVSPIAPGAFVVSTTNNPIFSVGGNASYELQMLAEDGNPVAFPDYLVGSFGAREYGVFNVPVGGANEGVVLPGQAYEFSFTANAGDFLSFATMLVQSNDLFYGGNAVALFDGNTPISGDITSEILLYDAGTEVNEYPGAGNNQPPRQSAANTGTEESVPVAEVSDSFTYPSVQSVVKVTVTPM